LKDYNGGSAKNPSLLGFMPAVLYKLKDVSEELTLILPTWRIW
jgi:hypothetical protein